MGNILSKRKIMAGGLAYVLSPATGGDNGVVEAFRMNAAQPVQESPPRPKPLWVVAFETNKAFQEAYDEFGKKLTRFKNTHAVGESWWLPVAASGRAGLPDPKALAWLELQQKAHGLRTIFWKELEHQRLGGEAPEEAFEVFVKVIKQTMTKLQEATGGVPEVQQLTAEFLECNRWVVVFDNNKEFQEEYAALNRQMNMFKRSYAGSETPQRKAVDSRGREWFPDPKATAWLELQQKAHRLHTICWKELAGHGHSGEAKVEALAEFVLVTDQAMFELQEATGDVPELRDDDGEVLSLAALESRLENERQNKLADEAPRLSRSCEKVAYGKMCEAYMTRLLKRVDSTKRTDSDFAQLLKAGSDGKAALEQLKAALGRIHKPLMEIDCRQSQLMSEV